MGAGGAQSPWRVVMLAELQGGYTELRSVVARLETRALEQRIRDELKELRADLEVTLDWIVRGATA